MLAVNISTSKELPTVSEYTKQTLASDKQNMYALSRPGRQDDDEDDGRPPGPPPRTISTTSSAGCPSSAPSMNKSGGGVAAAIARTHSSRKKPGRYQEEMHESIRPDEKRVASYVSTGSISSGDKKPAATRPGAVAVPGIPSESFVSNTAPTNNYQDSFAVGRSAARSGYEEPQAVTKDAPTQDQPIEATRVVDEEADIEAQVQSRMQNQAKDIADMVHEQLIKNAAVAVDVQPSVQDTTSSVTTRDRDDATSDDSRKKKRICLIAIAALAVIVAIAAGVGVAVSKKSDDDGGGGSNVKAPQEQCSFCYDGTIPENLEANEVADGGQTCAQYFDTQVLLESTDVRCSYGQAVAWLSCECPTLPPPPENPSCTICNNGAVPSGNGCEDLNTLVAVIGEDALTPCDDLVQLAFEAGCTCPDGSGGTVAAFQKLLEPISGDALNDADSLQYEALDWLANEDLADLSIGETASETIENRYVAAVLYYALEGQGWQKQYNFLSEGDICTWNENGLDGFQYGIACDSIGNVVSLRLPENNLVASIPQEIGYWSNLRSIDIANNTITGGLPSSLKNLTRLEFLNFTENRMSGPLPEYLFTHLRLTHIRLDDNAFTGTLSPSLGTSPCPLFWVRNNKLTGPIPSSVGRSSTLGTVNLHGNELTGTLPEFVSGSSIWSFLVGDNKLVGTIPQSIGSLSRLQKFSVSANSLRGPIPLELAQCQNLQDIYLYNNTAMTGTLPTELGSLPFLRYLHLYNNRFEGSIPSELGNLGFLDTVLLYNNRLNGAIPELAGCTSLTRIDFAGNYLTGNIGRVIDSLPPSLESFDMSANQLEGTIPTTIGSLSLLDWFDVFSNKLNGTIPNELGSLSMLEDVNLAYNSFTGSVPTSLASLPRLVNLWVQGNDLTGSLDAFCGIAFELFAANTCSEPYKMECACCTHCCRLDTYTCEPLY